MIWCISFYQECWNHTALNINHFPKQTSWNFSNDPPVAPCHRCPWTTPPLSAQMMETQWMASDWLHPLQSVLSLLQLLLSAISKEQCLIHSSYPQSNWGEWLFVLWHVPTEDRLVCDQMQFHWLVILEPWDSRIQNDCTSNTLSLLFTISNLYYSLCNTVHFTITVYRKGHTLSRCPMQ